MERKGQRNTRRQRRSRSWLFKPVIIAQLVVVMMLAGVGAAFAVTPPENIGGLPVYAATASITDSVNFEVASYTLAFSDDLTTVTGVTISLKNLTSPLVAKNATVKVSILKGVVAQQTKTIASASYTLATTSVTVTFDTPVPLADVESLKILVTEP